MGQHHSQPYDAVYYCNATNNSYGGQLASIQQTGTWFAIAGNTDIAPLKNLYEACFMACEIQFEYDLFGRL
jgi:hypothetical protein